MHGDLPTSARGAIRCVPAPIEDELEIADGMCSIVYGARASARSAPMGEKISAATASLHSVRCPGGVGIEFQEYLFGCDDRRPTRPLRDARSIPRCCGRDSHRGKTRANGTASRRMHLPDSPRLPEIHVSVRWPPAIIGAIHVARMSRDVALRDGSDRYQTAPVHRRRAAPKARQ
jgi:hypothetical protein